MPYADNPQRQKTLDELPEDVRAMADAIMGLLNVYMKGGTEFDMLVGRNVTATITFKGGPVTQEVISDTLAHLVFYKKYFPKDGQKDTEISSADAVMEVMVARWKEHREETQKQIQ